MQYFIYFIFICIIIFIIFSNQKKLAQQTKEFDCHGQGCCSTTIIDEKLVEYVQRIRDHFGRPVTITSSYRCEVHNRRVGGATKSYHMRGQAADIVVQGVSSREVAKYAESIGILGIGLYETSKDGYFTHIDTRTTKSFWYGQACAARTTFGGNGSPGNSSSNTSTTNNSSVEISLNDTGATVKKIQEMLQSLGYNITADGIFGLKTYAAVRDFQAKNKLTADGIVGPKTLAVLEKATSDSNNSYQVRITANLLNVRSDAGTNNPIVGRVKKGSTHTILQTKDNWGRINNPSGWISLEYTEKI